MSAAKSRPRDVRRGRRQGQHSCWDHLVAHPLIHFLDGPSGRRASLIGRGLDVWEVVATVRDNDGSVAEAASYLAIPVGLVQAAVAYYGEHRDEIDDEIARNEVEFERGVAAAAAGERAVRS